MKYCALLVILLVFIVILIPLAPHEKIDMEGVCIECLDTCSPLTILQLTNNEGTTIGPLVGLLIPLHLVVILFFKGSLLYSLFYPKDILKPPR